ncbi:MAG: DnaB-like helicase C-terminal domain-containing protein [Rikenellaceae bacterium]
MNELFEKIEQCSKDGSSFGVNCGYTAIDEALSGFNIASLNVIGSRPSMGKSSFIETMMLNMSTKLGLSVLYFSLESQAEDTLVRFAISLSGISLDRLKSGKLTPDEWKHLEESTKILKSANLYIETPNDITIDAICQQIRDKFELAPNINAVFIDYLQLISADKSNPIVNREQEIGHIARRLKFLAKELNIPIFITSQLNRRSFNENRNSVTPQLEDLRDSGVIEDVADTITFIHRPEYYGIYYTEDGLPTSGLAEINIIKNRYGSTHNLVLRFIKEQFRFEDMNSIDNESDFSVNAESMPILTNEFDSDTTSAPF